MQGTHMLLDQQRKPQEKAPTHQEKNPPHVHTSLYQWNEEKSRPDLQNLDWNAKKVDTTMQGTYM